MRNSQTWRMSALLASAGLFLAACGGDDGANGDSGGDVDPVTIGISQIAEHPSLDEAREGFKDALLAEGYDEDSVTFDEQNAQGEMETATSIATKFDADDVDLILAIGTPAAQATAQSVLDIPALFTAVTEPEEAGLVDSWDEPGANVTGTSDLNPVEDQIGLIPEVAPDAESVGIIYSSGEVNSEVQVELANEAADELGLTVEETTISAAAEVGQAAESLKDVDAFYVPTDNTVVEGLESIIQVAEDQQIPVVVGEGDSVERGGLVTYGLNYHDLGYQTGEMAVRILLEDEDPAAMPVETQEDVELIVNESAAERMSISLSDDLLEEADEVISD